MHGETILCIATRAWRSLWRDSQQIMSRIAAQNRVLYFEPSRNPDRPLPAEMLRNLPNFFALRSQELQENLFVIPTPSSLTYAHRHLPRSMLQMTTPIAAKINSRILIRHVRWAMRELDVERPILWLYEPRDIDLAGKFGEKLVCYYNYDEYSEFTHNWRIKELLSEYDNRLSRRADVVFATSRGQWQRRKELNPNTHFIPNGVDFNLFHRALDPNTRIPAELAGLNRPVIGLAGWLGSQIDVDLLVRVARAYPDAYLVLVGPDCLPDDARRRQLRAMPNVIFTGQKELKDLPRYLKAFEVALIPYVIGGHTLTVYPLKLHEYLAAGRAVVATALPELWQYGDVVRIAHTYDDFIQQIREALHDYTPYAIEARIAVARENTWDQRVAATYRLLQQCLDNLGGGRFEERVYRLDTARSPK